MIAKRSFPVLLVCLPLGIAAGTVLLEPYGAAGFNVSMPRSWKVEEGGGTGVLIARQDPNRADSAAVVLVVKASGNSISEDKLLDTVANQFAKDLRVVQREAIPGGGHMMIANGRAGSIPVRIGGIAMTSGGASLVSLLVSKPGEFDALGGIELVTSIIGSIQARSGHAPPPPTTSAAPAPSAASARPSGKLDVPPLARAPTVAELAGEWNNDDSVVSNYVNYSGNYAGYQSVATREKWIFDGKGGVSSGFTGTTSGNKGTRQVNEKKSGTVIISPGNIITLAWNGAAKASFIMRGWREMPGMTVLLLNGPWYNEVPADVLADRNRGKNLNSYWIRKAKP